LDKLELKGFLVNRKVRLAGVDIGTSSIHVAQLTSQIPEGQVLEFWGSQRLPQGTIVDGSIERDKQVVQAIGQIISKTTFRRCKVAAALPSQFVLFKKVSRPRLPDQELRGFLHWDVAKHFSADPDEITLDYSEVAGPNDKTRRELLVAAAPTEKVFEFSKVIRSAGLKPALIDSPLLTLYNLYLHNYGADRSTVEAVLRIGTTTSYLVVVRGRSLILSQVLTHRLQPVLQSIPRQPRTDIDEAKHTLHHSELPTPQKSGSQSLVNDQSESMALELEKTLLLCHTKLNAPRIDKLYICGEGCLIPGLPLSLSRVLKVPVDFLNPLRRIKSRYELSGNEETESNHARYALSIGLALRMVQGT